MYMKFLLEEIETGSTIEKCLESGKGIMDRLEELYRENDKYRLLQLETDIKYIDNKNNDLEYYIVLFVLLLKESGNYLLDKETFLNWLYASCELFKDLFRNDSLLYALHHFDAFTKYMGSLENKKEIIDRVLFNSLREKRIKEHISLLESIDENKFIENLLNSGKYKNTQYGLIELLVEC